ncbi:MAG: InlB B-repeat-containing protein [Clostridia bacterium]|nr:InlB B-repeat-containing protein [Clostridia bacterium]
MNVNENRRCCFCGETIENLALHGGIRKIRCESCGHEWIEPSKETLQEIYDLHTFCDEVISIMSQPGTLRQKRELWQSNTKLKNLFGKYGAQTERKAFFAICCAAYQTCGFLEYKNFNDRDTEKQANEWYQVAKDYLDAYSAERTVTSSDKQILKRYVRLYEKRLLHKKRNRSLITVSVVGGVLVLGLTAGAIIGSSYTPVTEDPATGITITVPNDAVSIFDKFNVQIDAEQKSQKSVAYVDAKNALRNETGTFVLYDIALLGGKEKLDFDGSVKVEVPIPEGFDTSALKVYHIASDEEYEEIPCSVSLAKNTVTFHTTHFSYYAIAERHPLVSFDTVGAGEIERQSVKRDTLASEPTAPQKTGYTFGGWTADGELWDFAEDTVKKDVTLTAKWIPNQYGITLEANGGSLQTQSFSIAYMSTFASLPESVTKNGYTFLGWYTSASGGTQVTRDTVMQTAGDLTLHARFEANENQIHFHANGGTGTMADVTLTTDASAKLPAVTFTRPGYLFLGWSSAAEGEVEYANKGSYLMGPAPSYTLYAIWQAKVNTLSFHANGGEGTMEKLSLRTDQTVTLPANGFTKPGYHFAGWSFSANGKAVLADLSTYQMGAGEVITLYAVWEKNSNTLVFNSNNGIGAMAPISVKTDETAALPVCAFTKKGYTFLGWSDAPNGRVLYADGSQYLMGIASSYTLYAVWEANEYHVSFDANGGTGEMASLNIRTDEKRPLPANKFERPGYIFKGWNTAHGDVIEYADLAEYTMTAAKDVVLYAVWEERKNELHFQSGGGSGTMDMMLIKTGQTVSLPANAFARPGYTFIGWSKTNGGAVNFAPGALYQMGADQKYTLYAVWKVNRNTVKFHANGGEGAMPDTYGNTDSTMTLPACAFTREGYVFIGWSKTAGSRTADYAAGATYTVGPESVNTLYAVWSGKPNRIAFHANGGEGAMNPTVIPTGDTAALTENRFTKRGHTFLGWAEAPDGEARWSNTADFTVETYGNRTLYAVWIPTDYEISLETRVGDALDKIIYTVNDTVELPVLTLEHYVFEGWYANADFSGDRVEGFENETENKVFYAKWIPVEYTLTFEGTSLPSVKYNADSEGIVLPTPERTGYTFLGWFTDADRTEENRISEVPAGSAGDRTFYPKWEAIAYTVVYDPNGGEGEMQSSDHVYDVHSALHENKFTRTHYIFIGWSLSKDGGKIYADRESVLNLTGESGTVTLYAQWEAIRYTVSFDPNGGDPIAPHDYTVNDLPYALPTPTRAGYRFVGWYDPDGPDKTAVGAIPENSSGNKAYRAQWVMEEYTVSWMPIPNGALTVTRVAAQLSGAALGVLRDGDTVYYGDKLEIAYTADTGYHFEASGSAVFTRTLDVTRSVTADDVTVTPVRNPYTIVYDGNGGTPSIPSEKGVYGSADKITATASRHGWIFLGWADTNGNPVSERDPNHGAAQGETVTLYAQWKPIDSHSYAYGSFVVSNELNGAKGYYATLTDVFDLEYLKNQGYTVHVSLSFTLHTSEKIKCAVGMYNGTRDIDPKIFGNGVEELSSGSHSRVYGTARRCSDLGNPQIGFLFAENSSNPFFLFTKSYTVENLIMTVSFTK